MQRGRFPTLTGADCNMSGALVNRLKAGGLDLLLSHGLVFKHKTPSNALKPSRLWGRRRRRRRTDRWHRGGHGSPGAPSTALSITTPLSLTALQRPAIDSLLRRGHGPVPHCYGQRASINSIGNLMLTNYIHFGIAKMYVLGNYNLKAVVWMGSTDSHKL